MNDENPPRFKTLFAQALELPPEERGAFLDAACRGEPTLRADVESLLAYDSGLEIAEHDEGFLKSPLVRRSEETPADDSLQPLRMNPRCPFTSAAIASSAGAAKEAWASFTRPNRTTRAGRSPSR